MKIVSTLCKLMILTGRISILCIVLPGLAWSQFTVDYSKVYGGSGIDGGNAIALSPDESRLLVGGRAYSSDFFLHENEGGSDFWLMEMNSQGDTIWSRSYGGFDNDDIRAVAYNDFGRPAAFGTTWSDNSGDVPVHTGQVGAWLITADANGDLDLSVVYSGTLGEQGIDFQPLNDGGYLLLVQSTSPVLEGQMNHGIFDFWVARVNAIGDISWSRFLGGSESDIPAKVIRTTGGMIVVGATASTDGDITENAGGFDYWVIRLDLEGNMIWQKTYGGSGDDIAHSALLMEDGSILITGESNSTDGDRSMAYGGTDVWLVNIDLDGNLLWEKSYGGTDDDSGRRLALVGNAHLALVAHSKSDDLDLSGNKGRQDVWLAYLRLDGDLIQQMNYGGSMDDFGNAIIADSDSVVYFTGSTVSTDGNLPFPGYPAEDLWLMRMSADTVPCADNFECFPFEEINFAVLEPVADGPVICVNGCNAGASHGPFGPPGCTNFFGAAAWFKVKTDANSEVLSVQVTTPEFNRPQVLVLQGVNCQNFTPINCDFGTDGVVTIINMEVEPDTFYYLVIGDAAGMEGAFDLCVNLLDVEFCNRNPQLYVNHTSMGSPPEGPFQPGEEVQICYEVNVWDKIDCNGLQGIVPTFGPGWDSASFNSMGRPIQIDSFLEPVSQNGEWDWWPLGNVHYNFTNPVFGYSGGQQLPTGWYFVNYDDPEPNANPDQSIGDLDNCINDSSRWKVCFTLSTILDCMENLDCSVTVKTFADGEIGANVSQACQNDPPLKINRFLNCCINPQINPIGDFTICSGDTLIVTFGSNLNPPVVYSWGINISGSVEGAAPGVSNNLIFQTLTNSGNSVGSVTYTVQGQSLMCVTPFEQFTVSVRPQPSGNMTLQGPSEFCSSDGATVRFDFFGDPPFVAEYAVNGVIQPPVLADGLSTTLTIPVNEDALVSFVGFTDRHGCEGDPNGAFNVTVHQASMHTIDAAICQGDSFQVGDHMIGFPGMYVFTLEGAAANGCDSIVTVNLEVNRNYERSIFQHICTGQVFVVGPNVYSEPGFYSDTLQTVHGCDSIVHLTLAVSNEIFSEESVVICAGESIEFGGNILFEDGTYYDTVAITNDCDSIYILNLNVLDVIILIQTMIVPDTGNNSGSIAIQVAGGIPPYQYLWSTGDTSNQISGLATGNYSLTVTDAVGCSAEFNFFLVSSTDDLLPGFTEVVVYPNPSGADQPSHLRISREQIQPQTLRLRIADIRGIVHEQREIRLSGAESHVVLNNTVLQPGLYFILLEDPVEGNMLVRKFLIQ